MNFFPVPAHALFFASRSVSTFIDTLDVPWPRTFGTIMSRVNIVNVNFLQLPKTACLYPNTPFYSTFQGYTRAYPADCVIGCSRLRMRYSQWAPPRAWRWLARPGSSGSACWRR